MGKTVEFALDTEKNSSYGLRKVSPSKNNMIGQGEVYPRWRGPGYKEPNNDPNYIQEDTKNDAKLQNDDTKTLYEKLNLEQEINEKEWWMKLEKLKHQNLSNVKDGQEEIVIKNIFGIQGASILQNFARQLDLH